MGDSAKLMVLIQHALNLTQKEMAELVGVDRRTIQRWQDRGATVLSMDEAQALSNALRPTRPDLADAVMEYVRSNDTFTKRRATPEALDAVLAAATAAGGTTPDVTRAVVWAVLAKVAEQGLTAQQVLEAMT